MKALGADDALPAREFFPRQTVALRGLLRLIDRALASRNSLQVIAHVR